LDRKGTGGADGRTGAAMGTFSFALFDILPGLVDFDAMRLKVVDTILKGLAAAEKLEDHDALFPGKDFCLENIEGQVKVLGKVAYQRLLHLCFWKMENKYFGLHDETSAKTLYF
jgi:hypothetical protein